MAVSNAGIHQVVCTYQPDNPSRNRGFGPVASSLPMAQDVSLFQLASAVLRPPGDAVGNSIAYERLSSHQDVVVRRVMTVDHLRRENLLSHALVAEPGRLTAELALGLDESDWPLGDEFARVELGQRLDRPDPTELERRGREGADRLRETGRGPALTEGLCYLTTWLLTRPRSRFSIDASLVAGEPRAALLALVDMLSPVVPGRWTFSTLESVESEAYRLIVMPKWPLPGSREYGRLRLGGRLAPDGPAHEAASLLVMRYQTHGLPGLDLLRDRSGWYEMTAADRAERLRDLLARHAGTAPLRALPAGPALDPAGAPEETQLEAEVTQEAQEAQEVQGTLESAEEPDEHPAPDGPETGQVPEPADEPEPVAPRLSAAPLDPPPEEFVLSPSGEDFFADTAAERHNREAAALVERLLCARSDEEGQELLREVSGRAAVWNESQTRIVCLTAIRCRLGVRATGRRPEFRYDAQSLFDLLIRPALCHEEPARDWAWFVRDQHTLFSSDPLRSVMRGMLDQTERGELDVHHSFFDVLGPWATRVALRLGPLTKVPPPPDRPPDIGLRPRTGFLRGRRGGKARGPRHAGGPAPAEPEGNTDDYVLLGKALLFLVGVVIAFVVAVRFINLLP